METTPNASAHPKYRSDIDGLRAIAVLSVVGFHAFPVTVKGGFIGVDIFFVISGFLISTIIFGHVSRQSFSFVDFYSRRIKRIFPALIVVLTATLLFGGAVLLADEFRDLGKHIAGGSTFISNFVLWSESGYFDTNGDSKPLLHLWSLGIEEQFYIFWPVILCVAWRKERTLLYVASVIAVVSFAFNIGIAQQDAIADFYSPLSRSWELLLGALLAYLLLFHADAIRGPLHRARHGLSIAGMIGVAASLSLIRSTGPFPAWWALMPCLATVLLIAAGPTALLNRLVLSNPVLVWFGLISFPLYLWHWPILSFLTIVGNEYPTRTQRLIAIIAAIVLAWLTYRLVEIPLRFKTKTRIAVPALIVFVMALGAIGFLDFRSGGFLFRPAANPPIVNAGDIGSGLFHEYIEARSVPCMPLDVRDEEGARCAQSESRPIDIAIIGDSHAESIYLGIAENLHDRNVVFYMRDSVPVLGNHRFAKTFESVLADRHIGVVIIAAWWFKRLNELPSSERLPRMQATLDALGKAGKTVYLVEDTPNFSFTPRFCKYESGFLRANRCAESVAANLDERATYRDLFARLEGSNPALRMLKTFDYFCDGRECVMARDHVLLFRDSNHLSINGSKLLADYLLSESPALRSGL